MIKKRSKQSYKRGVKFFHKETKLVVTFGKWNDDGSAGCITDDMKFLNIPRGEMDEDYVSYAEIDRKARERRRTEGW
jgi:hypothetical protein